MKNSAGTVVDANILKCTNDKLNVSCQFNPS